MTNNFKAHSTISYCVLFLAVYVLVGCSPDARLHVSEGIILVVPLQTYTPDQNSIPLTTVTAMPATPPLIISERSTTAPPTSIPIILPAAPPDVPATPLSVPSELATHAPPTLITTVSQLPAVTKEASRVQATAVPMPTQRMAADKMSSSLQGTIKTARLNVRHLPDANSYIEARISGGDQVILIGRTSASDWVVIDVFNRVGWVRAEYVRIIGVVQQLPMFAASERLPSSVTPFSFDCPGARGPSFSLGSAFVVPYGGGGVSIRAEPGGRETVGSLTEGGGGTILSGPICSAAAGNRFLLYWYVRTPNGIEGYVIEGFNDQGAYIAHP